MKNKTNEQQNPIRRTTQNNPKWNDNHRPQQPWQWRQWQRHRVHTVLANYTWIWGVPWNAVVISSQSMGENLVSLSQRGSIASSFVGSSLVKDGTLCPHLLLRGGLWSSLSLFRLYECCYSLCVDQPCCVWKTLCPWVNFPSWVLEICLFEPV